MSETIIQVNQTVDKLASITTALTKQMDQLSTMHPLFQETAAKLASAVTALGDTERLLAATDQVTEEISGHGRRRFYGKWLGDFAKCMECKWSPFG